MLYYCCFDDFAYYHHYYHHQQTVVQVGMMVSPARDLQRVSVTCASKRMHVMQNMLKRCRVLKFGRLDPMPISPVERRGVAPALQLVCFGRVSVRRRRNEMEQQQKSKPGITEKFPSCIYIF